MAKVSRRHLAKAIVEELGATKNLPQLARGLAAYLITERRSRELESLMRDVIELRSEAGVVEVEATSAFTLSEAVKQAITDLTKAQFKPAQHIIIDEINDPGVVGGVRLEAPGQQLDLTIHHRLEDFKQLNAA